jgi:hypothetical protein
MGEVNGGAQRMGEEHRGWRRWMAVTADSYQ